MRVDRRFRKVEQKESGAPKWMVTFADFIMLILVFFIMLFSMSEVDEVKFESIAESMQGVGIFDRSSSIVSDQDAAVSETDGNLDELLVTIQRYLVENNLEDAAVATKTEEGIVIVLQEKVIFRSAEAVILPEAFPILQVVGDLLDTIPNSVRVEGHTDDRPIETAQYPSNWELSTARASSVIRYFTDGYEVSSDRFEAVGYAETRPVEPNNGPENWALNRRVEIIILDSPPENGRLP